MYIRNFNVPSENRDENKIPDNYSGVALSGVNGEAAQQKEEIPLNEAEKITETPKANTDDHISKKAEQCISEQNESRLFSGLFDRLGMNGIDNSDLTLLAVAVLILSSDSDDYIWLLLLLLLLIH